MVRGSASSMRTRPTGSWLQWSHVFSDMVSNKEMRQMETRIQLQWSHVFSDMVSGIEGIQFFRINAASMEPCLFRHGKQESWSTPPRSPACASMEPCLFRHGKDDDLDDMSTTLQELQWSHVFSDMVRKDADAAWSAVKVLQWSHVFSDMVRVRVNTPTLRVWEASMEPCLFRHGKGGRGHHSDRPRRRFNGAMSFQTW